MERVASVKLISTTPESATNRPINREWRSAPCTAATESVSVVSCVSDSREAKSQSGPGVVSQRVLCAWCGPPLVTHGTRRGMGSRECRTRACGATILCCIEKGNGNKAVAELRVRRAGSRSWSNSQLLRRASEESLYIGTSMLRCRAGRTDVSHTCRGSQEHACTRPDAVWGAVVDLG